MARAIAAGTVARLSNNCLRSAFCNSPKIKSFASSTPIWRELSSKYRLCRSLTVGVGQDVISSSSKRGDHPPQYSDRPPTVYARPLNGMDDFHGIPHTSLRGGSGCWAFSLRKNGADGSLSPRMPVFCTCSGIVKSPASMTSVRSPPPVCFCRNQICSAIAEPKVPPPTTITSNGRPPADFQALTSETSLHR